MLWFSGFSRLTHYSKMNWPTCDARFRSQKIRLSEKPLFAELYGNLLVSRSILVSCLSDLNLVSRVVGS